MKKFIKIALVFVLVVVIAFVSIPIIFKGKIVSLIQDEANKKLHATLYFDQDVSLGIFKSFPNLNITINHLNIANKGKFMGDTLISAKEFSATIDLMSVISGDKIQIKKVFLDQPRIQVRVLKDGSANWDISIPDTLVKTSEDKAASQFKLGLKELKITDGYIVYDDNYYNVYTKLTHMNHQLSGDFTQDNFVLNTLSDMEAFTFSYGGVPYINQAKTKLDAAIDMDMKNFKFTFKENKIHLNELVLGVDGFFAMPGNDMDMDLKFNCKQTDFKNILSMIPAIYTNDFNSIKVSGKMGLNGFVKGIYNDVRMPAFGAELMVENGAFAYPSMPSQAKNINIDLKINNPDGVPDHTLINLSRAHAEFGSNPIDAKVMIKTPVSDPDIDATVKGKIILDEIVKMIPLDKGTNLSGTIITDLAAKGKMSAITNKQYENFNATGLFVAEQLAYQSPSFTQGIKISHMQMDFTPSYVNLADFSSTIGASDMAAKGKLENFLPYIFKNETLKGSLSLQSNYFNANQFISEESKDNKTPQPTDTVPLTAFTLPANIDFDMVANFKELLYDNLPLKNVTGELKLYNQILQIKDFKMDLFNGKVGMNGSYNATNIKRPDVDMKLDLKNMDIGLISQYCKTFKKYAPIADYIKGNFSTSFSTKTALDEHLQPQLDILTAIGNLEIPSFKIGGFEPLDQLASSFNQEQYKQLAIDKVKAFFSIENGRIKFKPFSFKLDQSMATLSGSNGIDLSIDYAMDMLVPRSQLGKVDTEINSLLQQASDKGVKVNLAERVPVKVLFGGTIKKPTIKIDLKDAKKSMVDDIKTQLKNQLNAKKDELVNKGKAEADILKQQAEQKAKEEADKAKQKAQQEADRLKKEAADKLNAEKEKVKKDAKDKLKGGIDNIFKKK